MHGLRGERRVKWYSWVFLSTGAACCMFTAFILVLLAVDGHPWGLAAALAGAFIGWWVPWLMARACGVWK